MATVVVMPRLSPTMEEGVLLKWTKHEGEQVNPGDVIAEVETDKANMDFPLEDEGTLLKLLVGEGETVKLGAPVAVIGEPGEDVAQALREAGAAAPTAVAPVAAPTATPPAPTAAPPEPSAPPTAPVVKPAPPPALAIPSPTEASRRDGAVRASPVARKLAHERGVDLSTLRGSGPGGRVVKQDVESAAPAAEALEAPSVRPAVPAGTAPGDQLVAVSPMRRTIARRLVESVTTVPHFYVTMDARADALWAFHQQVRDAGDVRITLNDLVLKAVATALRRVPEANVSFGADGMLLHGRVDLGIAVSIEDGLVTPVLRGADQKSLGAIARESRDLIERARGRKLRADEFTGSTFSVSNMGMLGVREFTAIINPPEGGILAVGAIEKRAVVEQDEAGADTVVVRRVMTLTVSADHRAIDGALVARLLGEIVRIIERPMSMVL